MNWDNTNVNQLVEKQRLYFNTGVTLDVDFRIKQLNRLKNAVIEYEDKMEEALAVDLGRCKEEAYFCDIGTVILEINEALAGIKKWAKPETHFSGLTCFPSMKTKVYKQPYGVALIISPFNFPFLLSLGVLTASIAGGNTAVIKASGKSPNCTKVLQELISSTFPEEYCCVVDGGHDVADICLAQKFDKIFYTGSPKVAVHVMEEAAKNLTPVGLELGGETGNWCVVRKDANLKDAARKIAFFKICNAGQICININQVAVAKEIAQEFIKCLEEEFARQIGLGNEALSNAEYPKLITSAAYDKCSNEAERYKDRILFGGVGNRDTLRYAPTVIYPVDINEPIVCHELFSPLLPIVPFEDAKVDELMKTIAGREHGLALYLFSSDIAWAQKVMTTQQYGGGCINEVCLHLMVKGVPFNGTGHSGMGAYHGEWGFKEFTHPSAVLFGNTRFNLPLREHPFNGNKWKLKIIRLVEK